jgi:hypothetical protein
LSTFIKWQITDSRIKQHELNLYKKTDAVNKKIRSKKIIELKIIDTNTYKAYYKERNKKIQNQKNKTAIRTVKKQKTTNKKIMKEAAKVTK